MDSLYIVVSDSVCEYSSGADEARDYAVKSAKQTKEETRIYMKVGTMCGCIAVIGGSENG